MSDLAIETHALSKRYGTLAALDRVNIHVERGSIYGFLGRNGAGKTTAIRILAGLAEPSGGNARVLGFEAGRDRIEILGRTGFVIDKMLLPYMNGRDLLRLNRGFFPAHSHAQYDALARRYAEALEVPLDRKFRKLSHGNKTKLCLLLALAQNPELLVLDEPTSSLDPVITDQLLRVLVEDFANDGRTILMSSHHLSEVEKVADWVGIIDHGRLLLEARLDDIRSNYRRIRVAGEQAPATSPEILTASVSGGITEYVLCAGEEKFVADLRNNGATVLEVLPMNLSEIFLELAGRENNVPVETMA
ncbi:MAG TPA: ABC transporter ATP-binding protein [Acidobacteriaceae bacterium]|nr:ABC transporter ATP-binding protein [Acidobacteriaceae bacterium]